MTKYLIVERDFGDFYAYVQTEKQFKQYQCPSRRRPISDLDHECALSEYPEGTFFAVEIKEKTSDKVKAVKKRKSKVVKKKAKRKARRKQAR